MSSDWTQGKDGRSNSSVEFEQLKHEIANMIHNSAYDLIAGRAELVAGLILARLAHKHGLAPVGHLADVGSLRHVGLERMICLRCERLTTLCSNTPCPPDCTGGLHNKDGLPFSRIVANGCNHAWVPISITETQNETKGEKK